MTALDWVCLIYGTVMALGAVGYRRRLRASRDTCADLRRILLERALEQNDRHADALVSAQADAFAEGWEACVEEAQSKYVPETPCDCPQCRAEKWAVN
jgi:hypothetical protein